MAFLSRLRQLMPRTGRLIQESGEYINIADKITRLMELFDPLMAKATFFTAWGIRKVSIDRSLFHAVFTYTVPKRTWIELVDGVEQAVIANSTSVDGKLNLQSTVNVGESIALRSLRFIRYQANRGHIYASSIFLPNPTASGTRRWGYATEESGMFFELVGDGAAWTLWAVLRTTIGGITSDARSQITSLPPGFDPAMGNTYDIQMQWRGVGPVKFFIGQETKNIPQVVTTIGGLNSSVDLSMFNPSNPVFFEVINGGDQVTIQCGCVDISTEGGVPENGDFEVIGMENDDGQVSISGVNTPVLVVRNNILAPNGRLNTTDVLALSAIATSDSRSVLNIWVTRDPSAITLNDQSFSQYGDANIDYVAYDQPDVLTPMSFDKTKAIRTFSAIVPANTTFVSSALYEQRAEVYMNPGDYFIFTMHKLPGGGAASAGVTFEFAPEH